MRALIDSDAEIVTWAWSRVEICGAVERRCREEVIAKADRRAMLRRSEALCEACDEVIDVHAVRMNAARLLARHPLRAAAAGQLGAALVACEGQPSGTELVCLDRNLLLAADEEGFTPVFWPDDLLD